MTVGSGITPESTGHWMCPGRGLAVPSGADHRRFGIAPIPPARGGFL